MNILPFCGYRYNLNKAGKLDDVISPPYDQFKEGLDDQLYARNPYNMARLIMNKITPLDTNANNRYTRSKALLDEWLSQQVFVQDPKPAIYPYYQDIQLPGQSPVTRKGFIALGEVTDYAARVVLPHERTLSKPKQDRLQLLRSTLVDTGLVFMLYSDPEGEIERLLDEVAASPALMEALDLHQERNRLWKIDEDGPIEKIQSLMKSKTVIIADGHHRYEVARLFRDETAPRRAKDPRWELFGYKLMSFIRLESEGIVIFPIHRLLHSLRNFEPTTFLTRLETYFRVEVLPAANGTAIAAAQTLTAQMRNLQQAGQNAFVIYLPALGKLALLSLKPETTRQLAWPADKSLAWRGLDVSVLQVVILGEILGLGEKELAEQTNLEYVSFQDEAIRTAEAKGYQCVFLLNPTPIGQVKDVVETGDLLPQKSTHFHPKLMEGLVFSKHL